MADSTNIKQTNLLVPVVNDIPESVDSASVFNRINRNVSTIPVKNSVSRKEVSESEVNTSQVSLTNPDGRPANIEEAAATQRRIRALLEKNQLIQAKSAQLISDLLSSLKDYDYQVDVSNNPIALKAIKKVFKKGSKYIDKKMYLEAIERFNSIQKKKLDKEIEF